MIRKWIERMIDARLHAIKESITLLEESIPEIEEVEIDYDDLASHIEYSDLEQQLDYHTLADNVSKHELAEEIDTTSIIDELTEAIRPSQVADALDHQELAEHFDYGELAKHISLVELRTSMQGAVLQAVSSIEMALTELRWMLEEQVGEEE